ncbi:hypothetical protein A2533_03330 [Candidatus Falkowbacteria bacterium RIFOXYD2_FULL_35_9]|uniref:PsbP C-terminal domain-containing protein n=1 Tax=Candidatus Falkowbacteria bacterium RIFOXYC2_FULL_36_12 TaxID=1798002 RepID=A0A1F5SZS9_9BACT|nr:MAG: hypothetical protein A2300_02780 [Candidatus Falkowbacteria bacterium RIFOXYB2_FULL_35_7]OGF31731.1 MAG: hypothetical protein A2478_04570 [Candidatus Falkowbacteria bacterium RIFOXYC2_FULL_36_12]OGF34066.1 MAG: hypothetical protein A2223_04330 [Candidatus Falkowbacteria bacterium RIFOXYA2_FULL_35_8]OGF47739.1 MAG: hypothetical protein A2533_03330 [Candidatus Falkowbacteria bacterium RIFOXYD2_FULL_35_9]
MDNYSYEKTPKKTGTIISLIAIALIFVLVILGIYFYINREMNSMRASFEQDKIQLEDKINELEATQLDVDGVMKDGEFDVDVDISSGEMKLFTNTEGHYSFKYPSDWNAFVWNNGPARNSLFGPNATSEQGLGGINVNDNSPSRTIDQMLDLREQNAEVKYNNRVQTTIGNKTAITAGYVGYPVSGYTVFISGNGVVYEFYLNSLSESDKAIFDQIVASFETEE